MANLKNITELPVAESAEGLNLIVNDNGAAKQIAASAVGAQADFAVIDETSPAYIKNKPTQVQADWTETDETSAAFVKNKPVEELDFNVEVTINAPDPDTGDRTHSYIVNYMNTFENIKNKFLNGENFKYKVKFIEHESSDAYSYLNRQPEIQYYIYPEEEFICFGFIGYTSYEVWLLLNPDDTVVDDT